MKVSCVIVDDEEMARRGLKVMLDGRQDVHLLKSCKDGIEAIASIEALKPDLVLLDVQMPGINGFEVLASIQAPRPQVVFITAHDQYAIRAFEVNAVDYLLKPFSDERFHNAIDKAIVLLRSKELMKSNKLENLIDKTKESLKGPTKLISESNDSSRLIIKADGNVNIVSLDDISHVEAYDYYIKVHVNGRFFLVRETMKKMFERLPDNTFIRIHKSYIVNTRMIKQYGKSNDGAYQVILATGCTLKVSRTYRSQVQNAITQN